MCKNVCWASVARGGPDSKQNTLHCAVIKEENQKSKNEILEQISEVQKVNKDFMYDVLS